MKWSSQLALRRAQKMLVNAVGIITVVVMPRNVSPKTSAVSRTGTDWARGATPAQGGAGAVEVRLTFWK